MSNVDEQIGRIFEAIEGLEAKGRDTLVAVLSDNGGARSTHPDGNGPLRGFKAQVFEGGIRVPAIFRWPGRIPSNTANASVSTAMDVFPTLAEILGVDTAELHLDGESFLDVLETGRRKQRQRTLHWEYHSPNFQTPAPSGHYDIFAIRRGPWKLVLDHLNNGPTPALYHLDNDAGEQADLALRHPAQVAALLEQHRKWRLEVGRIAYAVDELSSTAATIGWSHPTTT